MLGGQSKHPGGGRVGFLDCPRVVGNHIGIGGEIEHRAVAVALDLEQVERVEESFLLRAQLFLGNAELLERVHQLLMPLVRCLARRSLVVCRAGLAWHIDGVGKPLDI